MLEGGQRRVRLGAGVATLALAVTAAILVGPGAAGAEPVEDAADADGPLDISRADVHQSGRDLEMRLETRGEWDPAELQDRPTTAPGAGESYACMELQQDEQHALACIGQDGPHPEVGYTRFDADGSVVEQRVLGRAEVKTGSDFFRARVDPDGIGLAHGLFQWRAVTSWEAPDCHPESPEPPPPPGEPPILPLASQRPDDRSERARQAQASVCVDVAPDGDLAQAKLRKPHLVGCTADGPLIRLHGPQSHKQVALTFDDGPSAYTHRILDVLEHKQAVATFFVIGQEVSGYESQLRRALDDGDMIGNHTMHHEVLPSSVAMASASERIRQATGFTPCLFRPPEGAINSGVAAEARDLGMTSILWDVDPSDYSTPGAGAIYDRVTSAVHPGAIVVMHDGGGPRDQTVEALPAIIDNLQHRGYHLVTVTRLIGSRLIWRPR